MFGSVVVGVDGSLESLAAAEWACEEALLRGLPLCLLHAWEWQPYNYTATGTPAADDLRRHWAERIPREARAALLDRYPGLDITADHVAEPPAAALLAAAENAELLVLGSRGRSAVASLLIGSVALAVVTRATALSSWYVRENSR